MSKSILLFNINFIKSGQIQNICKKLNITVKSVPSSMYSQKMGVIAEISGFKKENTNTSSVVPFTSEMLVFSGITSKDLDRFLAEYKAANIPTVPLKAILTAHNIHWTPLQLHDELIKEHQMIHS